MALHRARCCPSSPTLLLSPPTHPPTPCRRWFYGEDCVRAGKPCRLAHLLFALPAQPGAADRAASSGPGGIKLCPRRAARGGAWWARQQAAACTRGAVQSCLHPVLCCWLAHHAPTSPHAPQAPPRSRLQAAARQATRDHAVGSSTSQGRTRRAAAGSSSRRRGRPRAERLAAAQGGGRGGSGGGGSGRRGSG